MSQEEINSELINYGISLKNKKSRVRLKRLTYIEKIRATIARDNEIFKHWNSACILGVTYSVYVY